MSFRNALFVTLLAAFVGIWPALVLAKPPAHAPAHGWRKKHDPDYIGYTGAHWPDDYGVLSGRCNREQIGTVLGGVAGATIGGSVADGDDRAVAIIIGAAAGALIGNRIGRELDKADRACIGHALELAGGGQNLSWTNPTAGITYQMRLQTDLDGQQTPCRQFTLRAIDGDRRTSRTGTACRTQDGTWRLSGASAAAAANRPRW